MLNISILFQVIHSLRMAAPIAPKVGPPTVSRPMTCQGWLVNGWSMLWDEIGWLMMADSLSMEYEWNIHGSMDINGNQSLMNYFHGILNI